MSENRKTLLDQEAARVGRYVARSNGSCFSPKKARRAEREVDEHKRQKARLNNLMKK